MRLYTLTALSLLLVQCKTMNKEDSGIASTPSGAVAPSDQYIDPKFEEPWVPDSVKVTDEASKEDVEKAEIGKVRDVIANFVAEMAENRKKANIEYATLNDEFKNAIEAPSAINILKRKRYDRYVKLKRILGDFPQRQPASFASRDVHRKTNGCFAATLKMNDNLSDDIAKGVFQKGKTYDAIVRYSNGNPRNQSDYAPDARGMAVKVLPENTLPTSPDSTSPIKKALQFRTATGQPISAINPPDINSKGLLDIVTINFPVFFVNKPDVYAKVNQHALHITDDEDGLSNKFGELVGIFFQGMSKWEVELALNVNGSIINHPAYQTYWSMATSRLGGPSDDTRLPIKYIWTPCHDDGGYYDQQLKMNDPSWAKITEREYAFPVTGAVRAKELVPREVQDNTDYLRMQMAKTLDAESYDASHPLCYDLQIQKFVDKVSTPVEDSTSVWLENEGMRNFWVTKKDIPKGEVSRVQNATIATPITIARLTFEPIAKSEIHAPLQGSPAGNYTANNQLCEDLSFNPWNNVLPEHRPLGLVQRMKRQVYGGSRDTRFSKNQVMNPFKGQSVK